MTPGLWSALAVGAVLVFWAIGAYNRLIRLRGAIGDAWVQVDEPLQQRCAALVPLVAALREHLPQEQGTLDALLVAQDQVRIAAQPLRSRPLSVPLQEALGAAEAALASALSRLLALLEQHPLLLADEAVQPQVLTLNELEARRVFARQVFNRAAQAYDEAAAQFPTRLVVWLFSLGASRRL